MEFDLHEPTRDIKMLQFDLSFARAPLTFSSQKLMTLQIEDGL